jgi:tetratricopeptide (TPR) repeat protein
MAEIFRATIGPDERTYAFELAIKRMHAELENDPKHVGMFLTEADVAKFLRHPNLVQVYEAGIIEGHVYIAMEYIWGYDLARLIEQLRRRRLRLPPELAVYIAMQVLRGLDYVHQAKNARGQAMEITHRDVTPSNIYVTFRGEVKLGDFGIAKVRRKDALGTDDSTELKGKVHYMPPEVLQGHPVTQQVDLWSLGVTLYEMLTARPLHEGVAEADMMAGNYSTKIEPVHKINPAVEPALSAILQRMLSPKVKKRPVDAASFYRELKQFLTERQIAADANALARFVRAGTGMAAGVVEPKSQMGQTDFANPEYLAPIEFSPTQRYEMRRRKSRLKPLLIGAPVVAALGLAMGAGYWIAKRRAPAAAAVTAEEGALEAELLTDLGGHRQQFVALMTQGGTLLKAGSASAAADAFRQAIELRPASTAARLGLARALYDQGRYPEAESQANQALQADPKNPRAYYLLGGILRSSGQLPRAKKAFQQCASLDPAGPIGKSAQQILTGW